MNRLTALLRRRWIAIIVMILSSLTAVVCAFAWHAQIWTWLGNDRDLAFYLTMLEGRHPLVEDLRIGRIRAGDSVDDLISRTKPAGVRQYKNYVFVNYKLEDSTRLWFAAKDGKLVYAFAGQCRSQQGSYDWSKQFFNNISAQEAPELALMLGMIDD